MTSPRVALVVLNWNGWRDTVSCLASLRDVRSPGSQLIVVDNGSTDDSVPRLTDWIERHPPGHGWRPTLLLRNEANLGFAAGNNVGFRHALAQEFPYVGCLNNDTLVTPDFLPRLVATLEARPDLAGVSPKIRLRDRRDRLFYAGGAFRMWRAGACYVGYGRTDGPGWTGVRPTGFLSGACFVARRALFDAVGLYDEAFFFSFEEVAQGWRARQLGLRLAVDLDAVVYHAEGASYGDDAAVRAHHLTRSRLVFVRRYASRRQQVLALAVFLALRIPRYVAWLGSGRHALAAVELRTMLDFARGHHREQDRTGG